MRGAFVIAFAGHAIDIPAAAASTAYGRPSVTPSGTNFTRPDELPVPVPVKRPVPDARFFQVPVVVRCGAGAWVGWNGLRFVCVIHVPVCPLLRVGSRLPRCLTGTGTPGLGLSHVRTRGFLLGPINDVQQ